MKENQLRKIQSVFDTMVHKEFVAGINCIIWQGGKEQGYFESGLADRENEQKISRNTIFRMYSMSKPVTSTAVMMLMEDGLIDLMDPVSLFIPEFSDPVISRNGEKTKSSKPVTIQDLLNMTSGYSYGGDRNETDREITVLLADVVRKLHSDHPLTTMDVARSLGRMPLPFEPGTDYQYGLSADILGAVVEVVSGMKFGEFLQSRLFGPLGMNDTGFFVPEEKQPRLAKVYQGTADGKLGLYTDSNLGIRNDMAVPPAWESGGAGLVSTADDYLAFCRMLLQNGSFERKQILQPQTVEFMRTAHLSPAVQPCFDRELPHLSGYSYGNLMRILIDPSQSKAFGTKGEYGWDGWLGTFMLVDPENDLTLVFMQQRTDCGLSDWTRRFKNVVYAAL